MLYFKLNYVTLTIIDLIGLTSYLFKRGQNAMKLKYLGTALASSIIYWWYEHSNLLQYLKLMYEFKTISTVYTVLCEKSHKSDKKETKHGSSLL